LCHVQQSDLFSGQMPWCIAGILPHPLLI
jgi:hypothetical protein